MRIERIDEKTVKCFLSNEELEEYDISYKDFVMRSDKAREVVEDIIEQAEEEVGYQPPRFAFEMQIMVLQQGMLLTFSERDAEAETFEKGFLEYLKNLRDSFGGGKVDPKGALQTSAEDSEGQDWVNELARFAFGLGREIARKAAGARGQGYIEDSEQGGPEGEEQASAENGGLTASGKNQGTAAGTKDGAAASDGGQNAPAENGQTSEAQRPDFVVFCFSSLRNVCRFAKAVPVGLEMRSALYCLEDYYYLYLERGEASYESYSHACIQALEFAAICTADREDTGYLEEHGECLIAQDALRKLNF